jgi:hypothetical protein
MTPASIIVGMRRADMRKARLRHTQHRCNSRRRGIPFELSFGSWLAIWMASGFWHKRGRRAGQYVMSRTLDRGSYVEGNVAIVPAESNTAEGQSQRAWTDAERAKIASKLKGNTNGAGPVVSGAARKRMCKGCAERANTDWLAHTTAANQSPSKRRKDSRGVKAAWARRRAEAAL